MLTRDINSRIYKKAPHIRQTRLWLVWLAKQLQSESKTEFLIEEMQPSWLKKKAQKRIYRVILGLIFGLIFGLLSGLIFRLIGELLFGLTLGLLSGLIYSLILGLISEQMEQMEQIEQISILKLIKLNIILGLILGLIFGLIFWLIVGLIPGLIVGLIFWLILGLFYGLMLVGRAYIQHFSLRLVLYFNGYTPWNYARFLDYCTELMLLQRVGGRYRFIHKMLQDHFAQMPFEIKHPK